MQTATLAIALVAAMFSAGCGIQTPSSNFENFDGTIGVGGTWNQPFHVNCSSACEISAELAQIQPDPASIVGLGLTTYSNGACQIMLQSTLAGPGQKSLSSLINGGDYCVLVWDAGYLSRSENFTVKVRHP